MGGKREKKFFPETHVYRKLKKMEKNRLENVGKHVFYKHMKIVTKNGGKKTREKIFSRNTCISRAQNDGKKSSAKVRKLVFYKHTNIVTKKGGKKRELFFRNTRITRKNDGKNRHEKVRKHVFYKQMNIITKKSEEKNAKKNFPKHTNRVSQKCWKKIVSKSAKTRFL